jgi:four helix bundle protein
VGKGGFEELAVWQKSKGLAVEVYRITGTSPFSRDLGLKDQMRRAAVSVPSNIAEGDERKTDREAVRYFYIAKGSAAELLTQAIIAHEVGFLSHDEFDNIQIQCRLIMRMLASLISARTTKQTECGATRHGPDHRS